MYADSLDLISLIIGMSLAVISGAGFPCFSI